MKRLLFGSILSALLVAPVYAASWEIPMEEQVPGGFDHIQILMANPYQFDTPAMSIFFGPSPVDEQWTQTAQNPSQTFAAADGPSPGSDPVYFVINVNGNTATDRPAFFFQAYLGSTLVDSANFFCTGPGNQDWVVQPGTWSVSQPIPPWLPGDANYDTAVDIHDALIWQQNYTGPGGTGMTWSQGDWNGDGAVDIHDMLLWQENYTGPVQVPVMVPSVQIAADTAPVPEPGTLGLLGLGGSFLLSRRAKR